MFQWLNVFFDHPVRLFDLFANSKMTARTAGFFFLISQSVKQNRLPSVGQSRKKPRLSDEVPGIEENLYHQVETKRYLC